MKIQVRPIGSVCFSLVALVLFVPNEVFAEDEPLASPELTPLGAGPAGGDAESASGEDASKSRVLLRVGIAFGMLALALMLVSIALQRRGAARASE